MSSQPKSKQLTIWIFQTGEPLHLDKSDARPMRAMNLANALTAAGHKVVLWSSAFYHQKKIHRTHHYETTVLNDLLEIRLIPSKGYRRNIGIDRLIDHADLSLNLRKALKKETNRPDAAFIGYPPIEFAYVATRFLKKQNIPTILDVKDQWPHIFVEAFPKRLQILAQAVFWPYFHLGKRTILMADSLTSMTQSFVKWGQRYANRPPTDKDEVFPLSPEETSPSNDDLTSAKAWWLTHDTHFNANQTFKIVFIGSISRAFNFSPIATAAKLAEEKKLPWQFIICGDGEELEETQHLFAGLSNTIFPGWINRAQIITLAETSAVGLAPYRNTQNFIDNLPNKVIDYLSLGLPILSPLSGEVQELILNHKIGKNYSENNLTDVFDKIYEIYNDPALHQKLHSNSLETYRQHFAGTVVYSRLVNHIESLVSQTPQS